MFLCGSVVEHCVSSAKGCGFDSQGTHILMKMYNLNVIVVALDKASAKCINVNVNVITKNNFPGKRNKKDNNLSP